MTQEQLLHNPHAGDILKHQFIDHIAMNATQLAHAMNVKPKRIYDMINGTQAVDDALDSKLCKHFKLSNGYFLRLQKSCDEYEKRKNMQPAMKPRVGERLHVG